MISRYTRDEMSQIWRPEARFEWMLKVEQAVAQAQAEAGMIPKEAAADIAKKPKINLARILELEATTKHDVIAFVSQVAETVGPNGRYIHYGLTSSDVLDTAISLQMLAAFKVLSHSVEKLKISLVKQIRAHQNTLCVGRTHGIQAEPTTFGFKLLGFLAELLRASEDLQQAQKTIAIGKLSGAVGTYSAMTPCLEKRVCELLALSPEDMATQVIPRDRHAEVVWSLARLGSFLERLAVELRHLQRTEVSEVIENFTPGQKGSSAMPHKKNPISAENITGLARLLRSYVIPAMENIALWHERDISHSSVERVMLPDAFILADYATDRMATLIEGLFINQEQMQKNLELTQGQIYSSHVLLALVEKGKSREDAYKIVQSHAHGLKGGMHLKDSLKNDSSVGLPEKDLNEIFSGQRHLQHVRHQIETRLKKWGLD